MLMLFSKAAILSSTPQDDMTVPRNSILSNVVINTSMSVVGGTSVEAKFHRPVRG